MHHFIQHTIKAIVLVLALTACTDNPRQDATAGTARVVTVPIVDTTQTIEKASPKLSLNGDTLLVNERAAVFIRPNILRIEKEKKKGKEEDFYIVADDYLYYMATAQEFLDSVKVPVIDAENEKFIKFIGSNKKSQLVNINKLPELWSIYLFDPTRKPKQADITAIEEEYNAYFN